MPVYVDTPMDFSTAKSPRCFRGVKSCHMYADTLGELHGMADLIGLKRSWFQDGPTLKHYDLVPSKRELAILYGAIEHKTRRDAVNKWIEIRGKAFCK